jgi:hypothetical protein
MSTRKDYGMNILARAVSSMGLLVLKIVGEIAGFIGGTAHDIGYRAEDAEERICKAKAACRGFYRPPGATMYVKMP